MRNDFTCEKAQGLFERFLDGELSREDEEALRAHVAGCPACRPKYALDLALIQSIRTAPDGAFESVAGEVAARVRVRGRRRWALRWGTVVAAICLLTLLTVQFGAGIYRAAQSVLTGSFRTSPTYLALSKLAGLAVEFGAGLKAMILSGAAPGGVDSYAPQVALFILAAGAVVILMMYGMGRWLAKPTEVNSWRRG
jgi:anti-sigma factor RsiW